MTSDDYPTQSVSSEHLRGRDGVDGLILCGGRGQRVDGADKGLLLVNGEPAVLHLMGLLQPLCDRLLISANRNLDAYRELATGPVIPDLRSDYPGPLAAFEAASGSLAGDYLLVLPVDMPELSAEVPATLLRGLRERSDLDLLYARTEEREHYLCAALRCSCVGAAGARLDQGEHAVRRFYATLRAESVLFTGELALGFGNRNRTADWPGVERGAQNE